MLILNGEWERQDDNASRGLQFRCQLLITIWQVNEILGQENANAAIMTRLIQW